MSEGMRDLSGRATPGEWHVGKHFEYEGFFLTDQVSNLGDDMDADDLAFIVALVNAYRSGQLHDDTALSQDRADALAQGRREGLEEANKKATRALDEATQMGSMLLAAGEMTAQERRTARAIAGMLAAKVKRSLATAPAETQKPETGESALAALERGEQP